MNLVSALLLLAASTLALAAPLFQTQVEALRANGMSEKEILTHLHANHPTPAYTGHALYSSINKYSTTSTVFDATARDTEGDISPGSLPSFHYAQEGMLSRLRRWVGYCERNGVGVDGDEEYKPAWRFAWMGGAWRSAASGVARVR